MFAQRERAAMHGERAAIHQLGAGFGQRAFIEGGKFFVEFAGQRELQHGVAKEFEPLIVLDGRALLMRHGRMRQREAQQAFVAKRVSKAGLEGGEVGHGGTLSWWAVGSAAASTLSAVAAATSIVGGGFVAATAVVSGGGRRIQPVLQQMRDIVLDLLPTDSNAGRDR
jgi:hypothetical protein